MKLIFIALIFLMLMGPVYGQQTAVDISQIACAQHNTTNVINLDTGLSNWRDALANANSSIITVNCIGDSITSGTGVGNNIENLIAQSWPGRLRTLLAARYGDVGRGLIPVWYHADSTSKLASFSAGWADEPMTGFFGSRVTQTANANISIPFNGTGVRLYYLQSSSTGGPFTVTIDGGTEIEYSSLGTPSKPINYLDFLGLTNGKHIIVIKYVGDAHHELIVHGIMELNDATNGIRINNIGKPGASSEAFSNVDLRNALVDPVPASLSVICIGQNDCTLQVPVSTYKANMQLMITKAKTTSDCLLLVWNNLDSTLMIPWSQYVTAMYELASENNIALLDIDARWTGSEYNSDNHHPNVAGHNDMAKAVLDVLLS
jgi:lysophospholipase L1-like esterase